MRLATQSYIPTLKLGFEEGIRAIKNAGFDSVDISLFRMDTDDNIYISENWKFVAEEQRHILDEIGLPCSQAHAPHIFDFSDEYIFREIAIPRIVRSMEIAKILGAECIVIHPLHHLDYLTKKKLIREKNLAYMNELIPIAEKLNIVIGFENMWQKDKNRDCIIPNVGGYVDDFIEDLDSLNSPYVKACLDIGHVALVGEDPQTVIHQLGKGRLKALHVHDNNLKEDSHTIPYLGKINWDEVMSALNDTGYEGDLTYEADNFLKGFPVALIPSALCFMSAVGKYLTGKMNR